MLKKTSIILFLLILTVIFFITYQQVKIPDGVIPQSNNQETIEWLSFGGAVITLVAAVLGLVEKVLDLVLKSKNKKDV